MLPLILPLIALVLVVVGLILGVGRGSWPLGVVRLVRRVRTARRRVLGPVLRRLRRIMTVVWRRPTRRTVADQLRRLADRVERMAAQAGDLVQARGDLSRILAQLHDIAVINPAPTGDRPGRIRKQGAGRDWLVAGLLAFTGLAFAAANVWVLTELVLPYIPEDVILERTMTIPVAASSVAFLLGLAYFALGSAEGFGGRVFRWAVWLLVAMLAVGQGLAVVTALEGSGLATMTWWGGTAAAAFLGLAGALIPAVIAALAHAAIERFERWLSARGVREARSALSQQRETAERLSQTLDRMEARVTAARAELTALSGEGAGRLLMAGDSATVERATVVLRRLARMVETDPAAPGERDESTLGVGLLLVRDLAALVLWLLASVSVLRLALPALAGLGTDGLAFLPIAAAAGIGLLLVMGAILRWILAEVPLEKATFLRGALVLLTGLAATAVGVALGSDVSGAALLEATATQAGAWLVLLILVAAAASAGLVPGVRAAAAVITAFLAALAWLVLAAADLALAVLDVLLTGYRSGDRRTRPQRSESTLGSGRQAR